jgi:hypothetical protein
VQFEAVSAVAMGYLLLESLGQVDDFNGLEGTTLDAHATADAQVLRNEANGRRGSDFDA